MTTARDRSLHQNGRQTPITATATELDFASFTGEKALFSVREPAASQLATLRMIASMQAAG